MKSSIEANVNTTILVVDDSPICREPIAEILRTRGFQPLCASSGAEALEKLNAQRVALVLLDVKMSGMDGLAVLRAIRMNPRLRDLPVLLLTDLADRDTVQQAARLGVQGYLLKSDFTMDDLISRVRKHVRVSVQSAGRTSHDALTPASGGKSPVAPEPGDPGPEPSTPRTERVEAPRRRDKAEVLDEVRRTLELKPIPPILQYVIAQTNSSQASVREVADTVRQDQALALRVMKVANSSFYSTGNRVRNLLEAAGRLGMSGIRNAVVTVVSMEHFAHATQTELIPQRFWEHSLGAAALGQAIAEMLNRDDAEELFLAALLHDIGRLALIAAYPDDYGHVLTTSRTGGISLDQGEHEFFGIEHAEVTREVLQHLSMPAPVVTSASLHERCARDIRAVERDPQPALIVALANRLAHAFLLGDSGNPVLLPMNEHIEALGIDVATVRSIGEQVSKRISDAELFYACHGDAQFREPLAAELTKSAGRPIRVLLPSNGVCDSAVSSFLEQLGGIEVDEPRVAVLSGGSTEALQVQLRRIEQIESGLGRRLGLLFVRTESNSDTGTPAIHRHHEILHLPVRYAELLEAIATLSDECGEPDGAESI